MAERAILLALALLLAGCTSGPPAAPTAPTTVAATATITGLLEAVGGPAGNASRPLSGDVTAEGGDHSYSVSVGAGGRYSITVPPGTYTMVGSSSQYQDGADDCLAANVVSVVSDGRGRADILCEEK